MKTTFPPALLFASLVCVTYPTSAIGQLPTRTPTVSRAADGSLVVTATQYHGEFRPEQAELRFGPTSNSPATLLGIRYVGHHRARHVRQRSLPTPTRDADAVAYAHPGCVERFHLLEHGCEHTFTFASRPAGTGDLVIDIDVTGNVSAGPIGAGQQPITLRGRDGAAVTYGEALAFDRDAEQVPVASRYDGAGRLQLIVPAAFVDRARYPMVVDPVVGSGWWMGSSQDADTRPAAAQDGSGDRYVIAWQRRVGASDAIHARLYAGDGTPLTTQITIANGKEPTVALHQGLASPAFVIAWTENDRIRAQLRNADDLSAAAPAFDVTAPTNGRIDFLATVGGTFDGAITIAHRRSYWAPPVGQFSIRVQYLRWPDPMSPTVIQQAEHVVDSESQVTSFPLDPFGDVAPGLAQSDVVRTLAGERWSAQRIVWTRAGRVRTASFRVLPDQQLSTWIQPPADVTGSTTPQLHPAVAVCAERYVDPTDERFLVAWQEDGDILGRTYDLDGPTGSSFAIADTTATEQQPTIGAGFAEFTVAYHVPFFAGAGADVAAARVRRDGTVAATGRDVYSPPIVTFTSSVAAASRPVGIVNGQKGNRILLAWVANTGYQPNPEDVRAALWEPLGVSTSLFGSPCAGASGELPMIGQAGGEPFPGNAMFRITLAAAPPDSIAALLISPNLAFDPIPGAPGCHLYVTTPFLAPQMAVTDVAGETSVAVPIPSPIANPELLGCQWAVYSPGANAFGWITSNDLDVQWHH